MMIERQGSPIQGWSLIAVARAGEPPGVMVLSLGSVSARSDQTFNIQRLTSGVEDGRNAFRASVQPKASPTRTGFRRVRRDTPRPDREADGVRRMASKLQLAVLDLGWLWIILPLLLLWLVPRVTADLPKIEQVWELEVGSLSDTCPAIGDDGTVYFGTPKGELFVVTSQGEMKWKHQVGEEIRSSPAIGDDGTVYFGSRDRHIYAVSAEGKRRWRFKTGWWVDSSPAIAKDGSVLVGSWDRMLYCLDPDGVKRWAFQTGGPVTSSPGIGLDGAVYFGSHDGKFYALNPDGSEKWAWQTSGPITSSPAINGSHCLYFTSLDGFLYALTIEGNLKWKLKTGGITQSSPVLAGDGAIYVGVNDHFWRVSPTGTMEWKRITEKFYCSSLVVSADGTTYGTSQYGMIRAFDPDGRLLRQTYVYDQVYASPALDADGILYLPGNWRSFLAFRTGAGLDSSAWPKFRGDRANRGRAVGFDR